MNRQINTDKLDEILKKTSVSDYDSYIEDENILPEYTISSYFNEQIARHGLSPAAIIEKSMLSREYAYQILNGRKKNPGRDKIIALCLGADMSYREIQRVLKIAGQGILYSKNGRDAAMIVCINNGITSVEDINEFLKSKDYLPLS
ncbi:MAG: helix-turn-helix domain-containing protein [Eubacterium sp.]|nr:helix-turn-helix domain-containing protein [Eubacterium sp.]